MCHPALRCLQRQEDQDLQDLVGDGDRMGRAPLKNRSIAITPAAGHLYNVWVKAVWYKPDGKVLGSVRHFTGYYRNSTAIYLSWCEPKVCSGCAGRLGIRWALTERPPRHPRSITWS